MCVEFVILMNFRLLFWVSGKDSSIYRSSTDGNDVMKVTEKLISPQGVKADIQKQRYRKRHVFGEIKTALTIMLDYDTIYNHFRNTLFLTIWMRVIVGTTSIQLCAHDLLTTGSNGENMSSRFCFGIIKTECVDREQLILWNLSLIN